MSYSQAFKRSMENSILTIAKRHLLIETLETRKSDSLDFYDVAVWNIRDSLEAAYIAGFKSTLSATGPKFDVRRTLMKAREEIDIGNPETGCTLLDLAIEQLTAE
jgi:hypothetical protein